MATKQQVIDAFYEGACTVLMSANVLGSVSVETLDLDRDEFRAWLAGHDEWQPVRDALGLSH